MMRTTLVATVLLLVAIAPLRAAEGTMKTLTVKTVIGEGEDQEVVKVYESAWTRILQITLRNGKTLSSHAAKEPVTIHCISGEGVLVLGEERIALEPGVMVPLEADVVHAVEAKPAVSLVVTRFLTAPK